MRTRCARRRSSSNGSTRSTCRSPASCSTGSPRTVRRASRPRRPGPAPSGSTSSHRCTAALLRLHARAAGPDQPGTGAAATVRRGSPDGADGDRRPRWPTDVHDLASLREVGTSDGRLTAARLTPVTWSRCCQSPACWRFSRRRSMRSRGAHVLLTSSLEQPRHEVTFGRRRSSARRSRSVIPPQTPHSMLLSRASARHSVRTGHCEHTCLARFCAAPRTKSSSGRAALQAADIRPLLVPSHVFSPYREKNELVSTTCDSGKPWCSSSLERYGA